MRTESVKIFPELAGRVTRWGNIELYRAPDALRLIEGCRAKKLPVFGIDGFTLGENFIQPHLEHARIIPHLTTTATSMRAQQTLFGSGPK